MVKHPDLRVVAATLTSGGDASSTGSQLYEGDELRLAVPLFQALIVREADGRLHAPRLTATSGSFDIVDFVVDSIIADRPSSADFDLADLRAMAEGLAPETAMLVAVIHREEEDPLRRAWSRRGATTVSTSLTAQALDYAFSRGSSPPPSEPLDYAPPLNYAPPPGAGPDVPPDDDDDPGPQRKRDRV